METNNPYVTIRDDRAFIVGHRIPITSLAILKREGLGAEAIHDEYPSLSLAQVFGGLAYYLDHQEEIDAQIAEDKETFLRLRAEHQARYPERVAEWDRRKKVLKARQSTAS